LPASQRPRQQAPGEARVAREAPEGGGAEEAGPQRLGEHRLVGGLGLGAREALRDPRQGPVELPPRELAEVEERHGGLGAAVGLEQPARPRRRLGRGRRGGPPAAAQRRRVALQGVAAGQRADVGAAEGGRAGDLRPLVSQWAPPVAVAERRRRHRTLRDDVWHFRWCDEPIQHSPCNLDMDSNTSIQGAAAGGKKKHAEPTSPSSRRPCHAIADAASDSLGPSGALSGPVLGRALALTFSAAIAPSDCGSGDVFTQDRVFKTEIIIFPVPRDGAKGWGVTGSLITNARTPWRVFRTP
jgi:hypothetical protein